MGATVGGSTIAGGVGCTVEREAVVFFEGEDPSAQPRSPREIMLTTREFDVEAEMEVKIGGWSECSVLRDSPTPTTAIGSSRSSRAGAAAERRPEERPREQYPTTGRLPCSSSGWCKDRGGWRSLPLPFLPSSCDRCVPRPERCRYPTKLTEDQTPWRTSWARWGQVRRGVQQSSGDRNLAYRSNLVCLGLRQRCVRFTRPLLHVPSAPRRL